jgi:hypothetical protein
MAMAIPTWLDIQMGSSFQSFLRIIDFFFSTGVEKLRALLLPGRCSTTLPLKPQVWPTRDSNGLLILSFPFQGHRY